MSWITTSAKEKSFHWDRAQTLMLIELYRLNPCLWNVKSDVYKDRNKRAVAINGITADLQRIGSHVNAVEVKRKIEIIRSQYRREVRKIEKSKRSGAGADMYAPTLWFFDELCFLNDGDSTRESVSNMDGQGEKRCYQRGMAVGCSSEEVSDHEAGSNQWWEMVQRLDARSVVQLFRLTLLATVKEKSKKNTSVHPPVRVKPRLDSAPPVGEIVPQLDKNSKPLQNFQMHRTKCARLQRNVIAPSFAKSLRKDTGDQ
ncbi:uncharacterized protein [Macrobrachium rosenbergii]|uniref:uncharacterized protein isoform X2 n=1 Tax=Macrobrachium rosenbergii TaxID=79674 RepID=UPI0034D65094